jgi:hypothetical protein
MRCIGKLLGAGLLGVGCAVFAAPSPYLIIDHSSEALMDKATALAVWRTQVDGDQSARMRRLFPVSKWGFISQVEGGFTADMVCVVTARAMMVPRIPGDRLVFKPGKSATTFASQPGATREQCRELAAAKLAEAVNAVGSSLIAP